MMLKRLGGSLGGKEAGTKELRGGKGLNNTRELLTGFHLLGASAKAVDCGPTEYGLVDPNSPPMAIWSHFQRWPPDLFLPRMIEG